MAAGAGARATDRLRLEPIAPEHAGDLWRLHQDDAVAAWHGGRWSVSDAHRNAAAMARAWAADGVGKWIAYDRRTGELVGRGGLSRMGPAEGLTGQIAATLGGDRWRGTASSSAGRWSATAGAAATPPRSAGRGWAWPSTTSAPGRWWRSPSGTTGGRGG
jgi:hypothetical protein